MCWGPILFSSPIHFSVALPIQFEAFCHCFFSFQFHTYVQAYEQSPGAHLFGRQLWILTLPMPPTYSCTVSYCSRIQNILWFIDPPNHTSPLIFIFCILPDYCIKTGSVWHITLQLTCKVFIPHSQNSLTATVSPSVATDGKVSWTQYHELSE